MRPAKAYVSLSALSHNFTKVRAAAPKSAIMAIIKANAYGHGAIEVARHLQQADAFAVSSIEEAMILRKADIQQPIVLLEGFFTADELPWAASHRCEVVVHQLWQVAALEQAALPTPITVWLKIDTGMSRLGLLPEEWLEAYQRLSLCPQVAQPIHLMSHLASGDDRRDNKTIEQQKIFAALARQATGLKSMANSSGILGWPDTHYDWVRPGIMLYGASPFSGRVGAQDNLKPVMTLMSKLIAVKTVRAGHTVGYGGTWRASQDTNIGIVALGYADGYPRHAPTGTQVLVKNQRTALIGRVSMDMLAVDVSKIAEPTVGDDVILWGEKLPVELVAESAGTNAYELLCAVSRRVPLVYC